MSYYTLGDVRSRMALKAAVQGLRADDARVLTYVNEALEELFQIPEDLPEFIDRWWLKTWDQHLTLPGDCERLVAIANVERPIPIRGAWYEFAGGGPGPQLAFESTVENVAIDRAESSCLREVPEDGATYKLSVSTDVIEMGTLIVQGYDQNGLWLQREENGQWLDGVAIDLALSDPTKEITTNQIITQVTAVLKPVTKRFIRLWATSGTDQALLGYYGPRETRPRYRRYYLPGLEPGLEKPFLCRLRKRFVPLAGDADMLPIRNLVALETMVLARAHYNHGTAESLSLYGNLRDLARRQMIDGSVVNQGHDTQPIITVDMGSSLGAFPSVL